MLIVATGGVVADAFGVTIFERSILITGSAEKLNALLLPDMLDMCAGALNGAADPVAALSVVNCGKLL